MDKVLVVAYSRTGTSLRLARQLARPRGWPVGRIEHVQTRRHSGSWLGGLLEPLLPPRPGVEYLGPPPQDFDLVVLVSPSDAARLAEPMRGFVATHAGELPDIAVIPVTGGGGACAAMDELRGLARRVPLLCAVFTHQEVDDGSCGPRLVAVVNALLKARPCDRVEPCDLQLPRAAWAETAPHAAVHGEPL